MAFFQPKDQMNIWDWTWNETANLQTDKQSMDPNMLKVP